MQNWLRSLPRSTTGCKSARKRRQHRTAWRSTFDHIELRVEHLEDRALLAGDVGGTSDLAVSNQAPGPIVVDAGGTQTYILSVTNTAATAATNVILTDTLATGVTNVSISGGPAGTVFGPFSNGAVTATIPTLGAGQTATFTVTATLNLPGVAFNTDSAEGMVAGSNQVSNSATVDGLVNGTGTPAVDLNISNRASAPTIAPGGTETYTLAVTNTDSTNAATGVVVGDLLPLNSTNVTTSGPSGVTFTNNNGVVTASLGNLPAGATDTLTITAKLASGNGNNLAGVEAATQDNNQSNNAGIAQVSVGTAQLLISKTASGAGTVGKPLSYDIKISNDSNIFGAVAGDASVTDVLPAGLTLVSALDANGTVTVSGSTITDTLGSLPAGTGTETLVITAMPTAALNGRTVTNTATLTFNGTTQQSSTVTAITGQSFFLQSAPGDGTIRAAVTNLYWNLLGRAPDPAGLQSWIAYAQMHTSALGWQAIVSAFMNSPEYKAHYVTAVYEVFLGRAPDASGLAYWTARMGSPGTAGDATGGADEKYILAAILGSDEFYGDAGGTPQGWINALFEDLLARAPESNGMAFWEQELSRRSAADRDGIVRDLLNTPEAVHDLLDAFYPAAGGTAVNALPPPGNPAGTDGTRLDVLSGDGWENLYFSGPFGRSTQGNDAFFSEVVGGLAWDVVQYQMLTSQQYYNNPNRPVSS